MTFTFTTPFDDIARVRLAINDMDSSNAVFTDEFIQALIDEYDDWQHAAIACVETVILQLSTPNFKADWLQVDVATARAAWEKLLARLQAKYGISDEQVTLTVMQPARSDDDNTSAVTEYTSP